MPTKSSVGLKKSLSFKTLIFLTVNSIMGTGIFFLPAIGAGVMGTSSILAWVILSIISIYIASLFGELCSMFPKAGGIYEFSKHVYPRPISFLIGWSALVASNITIAMLTIGAIQYLLPFEILYLKELISVLFILIFNYITFKGIKTSSTMLVTFAFITLSTLSIIIISNFINLDPGKLTPTPWNIPILLVTIFMIAETFFGWESPLFLAEETKNGHIVVPRALVLGTVFITLISLLLVVSSLGSLDWHIFAASEAPLLALAGNNFGVQAVGVFTILIYVSLIGSVAGWITTSPRLILSLAQDKMFPKKFAEIHPKNSTPYNAIIFQATISIALVFIGSGNYHALLEMLLPLLLLLYSAVILLVAILRFKQPGTKRYFNAPFPHTGPFVMIGFFGILFYFWITEANNALQSLQLAATFILMGVPVYFFMQLQYNPKAVNTLNNMLAYITLFFEELLVPRSIRQDILHLLGDIKGKTILEFGCSVGTLTKHLAEEVGPKGRIYATDISTKSITITDKRMKRKGHIHVKTLHDHLHTERVHPDIPKVEKIVSISVLDRIEKLDDILYDMNLRLEKGGRLCFIEYDRFFYIISNLEWIGNDTMIKHIFRRNGFLVGIQRKKTLLWETIYIYGKKIQDITKPEEYQKINQEEITKKESINIHNIIKETLFSHEHTILRHEIGVAFYDQPQININQNTSYLKKALQIIVDTSLYSCPDGGNIIISARKESDTLHLQILAQIRRKVLVLFLDSSKESLDEETHSFRKHRNDLEYLRRIINALGGKIVIDQIWEKYKPEEDMQNFILGIYEDFQIEEGQDYLNIDIHISDTTN
ncbi:MAG: amino acid permease [Candidatus Woesearchaeota archaeon]